MGARRRADGGRGRAPGRALRLAPARRRGRPLEAPAPEDRRVPRVPLRRPPLSGLRQAHPAAERGRARRLHRAGVPRHPPERRAAPRDAALRAVPRRRRAHRADFAKGSGYLLYHVLDDLFDYCFPILDKIGHKLDRTEDEMFEGRSEEIVRDISNVKQEIISYRKIIKPERSTLRLLERHVTASSPRTRVVLRRHRGRRRAHLGPPRQLQGGRRGPRGTNESIISHRQNDVLRVLTLFSVVLLPLTLLTGIFGMNVKYPGEGTRRLLGRDRRHDRGGRGRWSASSSSRSGGDHVERLWAPWRLEYIKSADETGCVFCRAPNADDEESLVVHRGELAFVLLNRFPYVRAPDGRAGGTSATSRARRGGGAGGAPPRRRLALGARRRDGAPGLQPRLEPRPGRGRGDRRSRPPARRPPLGRRHELHARARRREGAAGAPAGDGRKLAAAWPS